MLSKVKGLTLGGKQKVGWVKQYGTSKHLKFVYGYNLDQLSRIEHNECALKKVDGFEKAYDLFDYNGKCIRSLFEGSKGYKEFEIYMETQGMKNNFIYTITGRWEAIN